MVAIYKLDEYSEIVCRRCGVSKHHTMFNNDTVKGQTYKRHVCKLCQVIVLNQRRRPHLDCWGWVDISEVRSAVLMLVKALGYSGAAEELGVSITTVSRWAGTDKYQLTKVRKTSATKIFNSCEKLRKLRDASREARKGTGHSGNPILVVPTKQLISAIANKGYGAESRELCIQLIAAGVYIDTRSAERAMRRFKKEVEFVSLQIADNILIALGMPEAFNGPVSIIPNPKWTEDKFRRVMATKGADPQPYIDEAKQLARMR